MIHFPDTPEDFVTTKLNCNSWVATAVIGAAAVGGAAKIFAAQTAANAQTGAAGAAAQTAKEAALKAQNALEFYNTKAQTYLEPYQRLGQTGIDALTEKLPGLSTPLPVSQEQLDLQKQLPISQEQLDLQKPLTIDQKTLETLPGYQFAKTQGLKSVQNSAAARGLGVSGAALKGAASFATGLADQNYATYFTQEQQNRSAAFQRYATTYGQAAAERAAASGRFQQVWQNQLTSSQTAYDRLMGVINAGEGAAAVGGQLAQKTGAGIGTALTGAGTQVAGAQIGAGNAEAAATNAIGGAVADAANNIGGYAAYKGLYGGNIAPNMAFVKGTAGDQYVPTFGK